MDNLFYSREEDEDVENVRKINLDELYDTKKKRIYKNCRFLTAFLIEFTQKLK